MRTLAFPEPPPWSKDFWSLEWSKAHRWSAPGEFHRRPGSKPIWRLIDGYERLGALAYRLRREGRTLENRRAAQALLEEPVLSAIHAPLRLVLDAEDFEGSWDREERALALVARLEASFVEILGEELGKGILEAEDPSWPWGLDHRIASGWLRPLSSQEVLDAALRGSSVPPSWPDSDPRRP